MSALYNEIEPYPAQWLRNLIAAGHIAAGTVDDRSITELQPEDVRGAAQAHFFAGIGVWSAALRLAGWPDDRPVWTGSCPCQPFSAAGQSRGFADDRHLWPEWFRLIRECRPTTILGEQVASPAGLGWLDAVFADLEGAGYACAASDLCAAGVGAPHIRQRLYFVAHADVQPRDVHAARRQPGRGVLDAARRGAAGELADAGEARPQGRRSGRDRADQRAVGSRGVACELADPNQPDAVDGEEQGGRGLVQSASYPTAGFWANAEWIPCRDGKARPTEPSLHPLAHGATARVGPDGAISQPSRVGMLRAYGNAIVRQQAAAFIGAVMDALDEVTP